MHGYRVTLFTLFGFEVRADPSWLLLAALVTWSLAAGLFPAEFPGLSEGLYWTLGLVGMIGLFFSLLFHEFSHSLVARFRGMEMGGITLFLFGGMAEMHEEPPNPRVEAEVAIAGPLSSLLLAGLFALLAPLLAGAGLAGPWVGLVGYLALINVILAAFNLVPGYPLDGGRLLRAFLWYLRDDLLSATRTAARAGQGFAFLLIGLGVWSFLSVGALGGMWWVLIGLFLNAAAKASWLQLETRLAFAGAPLADFMTRDPVAVTPDLPLDRFVEDYAYRHHHSLYPVVEGERLAGAVRTRDVRTIPREEWPRATVADIMRAREEIATIERTADAGTALEAMQRAGRPQIIVTGNGRLAGIVTVGDLMDRLALKREIEGRG